MAETKTDANVAGQELSEKHEALLTQGAQQVGVAEVLRVYGQIAPYSSAPVVAQPVTRYAAGGNG